jgi:DNA-binding CsgD family transcriptional regulator
MLKEECVTLRQKGRSLPEIVRITGASKSTVYGYIKDIPLSRERIIAHRTASGKRARALAAQRRGVSKNAYETFREWDADTVRLIAHFIFDGGIYQNACCYNNRSSVLIARVERLMRTIYALPPKRWTNPSTGVVRISYYNVALAAYLHGKSIELLRTVCSMTRPLKKSFLQAFFDDEGNIYLNEERNIRRIRGYQKDVAVLHTVQGLLSDIGVESRVVQPNEVVITGKDAMQKFSDEIGFSAGVRINGQRSNSIWKESLEKREILRRAIASFKPIGHNGVHRTSGRH